VVRILILHCVSKKACDYIFCNNWNNECPIIIIFGSNVCLLHDSMDKDQLTFFGLLHFYTLHPFWGQKIKGQGYDGVKYALKYAFQHCSCHILAEA